MSPSLSKSPNAQPRLQAAFFFGIYENLRVREPKVANTYVRSLATLQNAQAAQSAVYPLLNAFPKPNGPDLGNGTYAFSGSYSDPTKLDSYSGRIDYLYKVDASKIITQVTADLSAKRSAARHEARLA